METTECKAAPQKEEAYAAAQNEEAHAARVVYETLAEALINIPTNRIIADIVSVSKLLDINSFEGITANEQLEQRFYERFFIATSPFFIPLSESSIRGATVVGGTKSFGTISDNKTDHVLQCYKQSGFNPRALLGFPLFVSSAHVDSMAFELSYMAFLVQNEISAGQTPDAGRARMWQNNFLSQHLLLWAKKAAALMEESDNDFYARVVALAAAWIEIDRQRLA